MRETLQALINLQEIDREIFKVQEELKRLPAEKQSRQNELDKRVARHTEIKTEAMKLRTRIKEIEDLTTTQRQRMRKVENEAAGSRATHPPDARSTRMIGSQLCERANVRRSSVERRAA